MSRRSFVVAAAAGAASLASPFVRRADAQANRVIFATWGGSWEAAMKKAWFEPFTKKTGIEVATVGGNAYAKVRAMVEAGKVEWDVVEVNPDFQWIGKRDNLVEALDFGVIDKSPIMPLPNLVSEVSVPQVLWSKVMFWNTKAFTADNHPRNWAEVWDVKKFPGKRAFGQRTSSGAIEAALLADGVPMDKLFPLDIDRALKSLSKIRDSIVWWDTNAQGEQYMTDGQGVLGLVPDGRALNARDKGAPINIEYNQSLMSWASMVIPRGAPNKAAAMKLLAYCVTPEAQAAIAMAYTYGPAVQKAYDLLPKDRATLLSGGPQQQGKFVMTDEGWWGENREKVQEKLNQWRIG